MTNERLNGARNGMHKGKSFLTNESGKMSKVSGEPRDTYPELACIIGIFDGGITRAERGSVTLLESALTCSSPLGLGQVNPFLFTYEISMS